LDEDGGDTFGEHQIVGFVFIGGVAEALFGRDELDRPLR
jgi:hypothetical protein